MEKKVYYCDACGEQTQGVGRYEFQVINWEVQKDAENIFVPRTFHLCNTCLQKIKTFLTKEL